MRQVRELPYGIRLWAPAKRAAAIEAIRREFLRTFGGLTETQAWGYWVDDNGNTVGEPVTIFEAFHGEGREEQIAGVESLEFAVELLLHAGEVEVLAAINEQRDVYRADPGGLGKRAKERLRKKGFNP